MLELCAAAPFCGRVVAVARGGGDPRWRSYDHRGQGYAWQPAADQRPWGFDVERLQHRGASPLAPELSEARFLCGWTRCEALAKLCGVPALLVWRQQRTQLRFSAGLQRLETDQGAVATFVADAGALVVGLATPV